MGRRRKGLSTDLVPAHELESGDIAITPRWLFSDYNDWVWKVAKSATEKTQVELSFDFRLPSGILISESEHANLVRTIKYIVYYARIGASQLPQTTIAKGQQKLLARLQQIVSWMLLRGISQFRRITSADLEEFKDESVYGVAYLLEYPRRFLDLVAAYDAAEETLPSVIRSLRSPRPRLDLKGLCDLAGIDMYSFRTDPVCALIGQKLAHERGLYVQRPIADFHAEDAIVPAPKPTEATTMRRLYQALDALYVVGNEVDDLDAIKVDPFGDVPLLVEVKNRSAAAGKTRTIPPRLALKLIDRSIRWVVEYGPELLVLRQEAEQHFAALSSYINDRSTICSRTSVFLAEYTPASRGPAEPWPIVGFNRNNEKNPSRSAQPSLHVAINVYLPMACAIVIMAFSARREGEVLSLREDCLDKHADLIVFSRLGDQGELSEFETPAIESLVEKTLRSREVFPTVEVVVKAIELLKAWSEDARAISGGPELFQYRWLSSDRVSPFVTASAMRRFAAYVEADTDETGAKWTYSDHQFRRFFAMIYFWRFKGGSLTALSQYLRHFNVEMTTEYVRETIAGDAFDEIHREKLYEVMTRIFTRETPVSGAFGERIVRVRKRIEARLRIDINAVSPDKFAKIMRQEARNLVDSMNLKLHLKSFGACFGGSRNRQHLSHCVPREERSRSTPPRPEIAHENICKGCPNFAVWDEFLPNLQQTECNAKAVMASRHASPVVRAAAARMQGIVAKRIAALEG